MIDVIHCTQGTREWHQARAGAITASMFSVAREKLKSGPNKGQPTAAARDYAFRLAVERISGEPLDEGFETYQMRRGHELEPDARAAHEQRINTMIEQAGFVRTADGLFGASADGLIDEDGGSEYKCLVSPERIRTVIVDQDLDQFLDQVQGCLWLTGRKWWHFCLYCPALAPAGRELVIHEVARDEDYIERLEADLVLFNGMVEDYRRAILNSSTDELRYPLPLTAAPVAQTSAHGIFGAL